MFKNTHGFAKPIAYLFLLSVFVGGAPRPLFAQEFYTGQIIMLAGKFCPRETAEANGQILPVQNNEALYSLLGNRYGGDAPTTFALPKLAGGVPGKDPALKVCVVLNGLYPPRS